MHPALGYVQSLCHSRLSTLALASEDRLLAAEMKCCRPIASLLALCHASDVAAHATQQGQAVHSLAAHPLQVSWHSSLLGWVGPAGDMGLGMRPMGMDMMGLSQALGMHFGGMPPGEQPHLALGW